MTNDDYYAVLEAVATERAPIDAPTSMERLVNATSRADFRAGAEWARTYLAAQEPTDAECIAVLNAVTTPLGEKPKYTVWFPAAIRRCREAMMSARAARRDEEER